MKDFILVNKNFLYFFSIFLIAFDFRRAEGDQGGVVVFIGVTVFVLLILYAFLSKSLEINFFSPSLPLVYFISGAALVGLIHGQSVYSVLAMSMPLLLLVIASVATIVFFKDGISYKKIDIVFFGCCFAALWKLLFGFYYYDLDVGTVRYQILSGATPIIFSYAVAAIVTEHRRYFYIALILSLGVVFVSVTRTYLIVFFAAFCAGIYTSGFGLNKIFKIALGAVVAVLLGYLVAPDLFDRWFLRLFEGGNEYGVDLTAATRMAEADYQVSLLLESFSSLFFGYGISAETYFSGVYAEIITIILGPNFVYTGHGYGHNLYLGMVYVGGLLFGGCAALWFVTGCLLKIIKSRGLFYKLVNEEKRFMLVWGASSVFAYIVYGMFAAPFGDRSMSFFYGIVLGMLYLSVKLACLKK